MKKYLLIFNCLLISWAAAAQVPGGLGMSAPKKEAVIPGTAQATPKGSAKIIGYVLDSTDTKPVEFASVALINKATNRPVDGASADLVGKFVLNKVA